MERKEKLVRGEERKRREREMGRSREEQHRLETKDNWEVQFSSVQSLSRVCLCNPMNRAAHQASRSITNFQSILKLMSIESVIPPNHLILCHPLLLTSIFQAPFHLQGLFLMNQLSTWGGQRIGVSASASVLPMNTQDWYPLGWAGWISLQSKGLKSLL